RAGVSACGKQARTRIAKAAGHRSRRWRTGAFLNSDEAELRPLAPGEFRNRLAEDNILEMVGLLMLGEGRFTCEHLIEEEFPGLGDVLVNLERLDARLALRLRQKIPQKLRDGAFLARIDFPKCGDDQVLVRVVCSSHGVLL